VPKAVLLLFFRKHSFRTPLFISPTDNAAKSIFPESYMLTLGINWVINAPTRCPTRAIIGNPVKFGSGPAAVIGDKIRKMPLFVSDEWEGADDRMIREPEDLPCENR
jgi:hypothetical protein